MFYFRLIWVLRRGFSPRGFLRNPHKLPLAPCSKLLRPSVSASKLSSPACRKIFAERRGFEPRKPFWSLHAFQACLFNHSSISPLRSSRVFQNRLQNYYKLLEYASFFAIIFYFATFYAYYLRISKKYCTFVPRFNKHSSPCLLSA